MTSPSGRRPSSTEPAAAEEKNIRRDITPMPRRFVSVTVSSIVIASPRRQQIKISKIRCSLQPFFVTLPINMRTYSVSAKKRNVSFVLLSTFLMQSQLSETRIKSGLPVLYSIIFYLSIGISVLLLYFYYYILEDGRNASNPL